MRPTTKRSTPRAAFTLIELIVVMTLLTVAIGLAAPRMASFFRGRTLDSEARRLLTLTRYAQDRAASEGVPMRLWLDVRNGSFGIEPDPSYQQTDAIQIQFEVDQSIRLEVAQAKLTATGGARMGESQKSATTASKHSQLPAIRFLPDGMLDESSPERVVLKDREDYTIVLSRSRNGLSYEINGK